MTLRRLSDLKHRVLTERAHELNVEEMLIELATLLPDGVTMTPVEKRIAALTVERLLRADRAQSNYKSGNRTVRKEVDALLRLRRFFEQAADMESQEPDTGKFDKMEQGWGVDAEMNVILLIPVLTNVR